MHEAINLASKLASFDESWVPKVVGELNGQHVKVFKADGEYIWHQHEHEDEMFLVLEGRLDIHLRDRVVEVAAGEFFVVPRGVEHKPASADGAHVLLFEPDTTRNTGEVTDGRTIEAKDLDKI